MLILALQVCPHDVAQAIHLVRLICDIEPERRKDVEFAIAYRRDTDPNEIAEIVAMLKRKFAVVHQLEGKRFGTGWPNGCNDLWAETMMRVSLAVKRGEIKADGVLTFEADCVPHRLDWIDAIKAEWKRAQELGKEVCGSVCGEEGAKQHINGNGIFLSTITRKYPELHYAPGAAGWDCLHGDLLVKIGEHTNYIAQFYHQPMPKDFAGIRVNKVDPALVHGIKGMAPINEARRILIK